MAVDALLDPGSVAMRTIDTADGPFYWQGRVLSWSKAKIANTFAHVALSIHAMSRLSQAHRTQLAPAQAG